MMAQDEPILTTSSNHEVAVHVRDYERFTKMFKWSAIICALIGFTVLMIL